MAETEKPQPHAPALPNKLWAHANAWLRSSVGNSSVVKAFSTGCTAPVPKLPSPRAAVRACGEVSE